MGAGLFSSQKFRTMLIRSSLPTQAKTMPGLICSTIWIWLMTKYGGRTRSASAVGVPVLATAFSTSAVVAPDTARSAGGVSGLMRARPVSE